MRRAAMVCVIVVTVAPARSAEPLVDQVHKSESDCPDNDEALS
jgi:hypothetical protein